MLSADAEPKIYDEKIKALNKPTPQLRASYPSKLFYFWAESLLWKGFRRPLKPVDLWDMDPAITSEGIVPLLDANLEPIIDRSKSKSTDKIPSSRMSKMGKGRATLTLRSEDELKSRYSVFPAMVKTFWPSFVFGSSMKIIADMYVLAYPETLQYCKQKSISRLAVASPQVMKLMIGFVEEYASTNTTECENTSFCDVTPIIYEWKGYLYAVMLLSVTMFQTVLNSQYTERMYLLGMHIRTSLISVIYRKSLRMSGAAR